MSSIAIDIIGFSAAIVSFVIFLPQALSTWKNRNDYSVLKVISPWTQYMILINATLWGVYAVITNAFWVGAPGLINAPLALLTIYFLSRTEPVIAERCLTCSK